MDVFIHKFISVTPKKILGKNCSELYFAGTNLNISFLSNEQNSNLDSKYSMNLKDIKSEINTVKKTSKTIIIKNGEPCLQGLSLKSLAHHIKQQGFFLAIETYGTKPNIIRHMIENKLVDIIILKLYFPLLSTWVKKVSNERLLNNHVDLIKNIKETINILKTAKVNVRVKTIIIPSLIYRKEDILRIAGYIKDIKNCKYELIPFNPNNSSKTHSKLKRPNEDFINELRDYVKKEFPMLNVS
jgi:pyruvate formate lyase activating enzyme